jgi:hypothetical protein
MKNVFFLLAMCCTMLVHANTYNYLVFTNTAGNKTTFHVDGLSLNVDGSTLQVTNASGTVDLVLTDLQSMEFSADGTTSLENVLNADAPVQVYSISGSFLGTYESMLEAAKSLHAGSYVISNGNQSQTIVIK